MSSRPQILFSTQYKQLFFWIFFSLPPPPPAPFPANDCTLSPLTASFALYSPLLTQHPPRCLATPASKQDALDTYIHNNGRSLNGSRPSHQNVPFPNPALIEFIYGGLLPAETNVQIPNLQPSLAATPLPAPSPFSALHTAADAGQIHRFLCLCTLFAK